MTFIIEMEAPSCSGCPFLNCSDVGEDCNILDYDIQEDEWSNINYQYEKGWRYEKCPLVHPEYLNKYRNIKVKK